VSLSWLTAWSVAATCMATVSCLAVALARSGARQQTAQIGRRAH
jgi:hypothetical protein